MNLLDLLILVPIVWGCIRGFSKGFIIELATLAGLVLGIMAAFYFASSAAALLREYFTFNENVARITAYVLIFITVMLLAYIIGKIIEKVVDMMALGWLNKILGALVGIVKGAVVASLLLFIIVTFDINEKIIPRQTKERSMFYQAVSKVVPFFVLKE
ncbi:MAG: CvpA family protein [Bacteroidales bacterium]|nr:CvpA family protein [Bacteroidales bacterium]